jgi:hypothetical protein
MIHSHALRAERHMSLTEGTGDTEKSSYNYFNNFESSAASVRDLFLNP